MVNMKMLRVLKKEEDTPPPPRYDKDLRSTTGCSKKLHKVLHIIISNHLP